MEIGFLGFSFSSNLISDDPNSKTNSPLLFEYEALDTSLALNSHRTSSSTVSKRKLNDPKEKEFLSLNLGLPFSSPAKETAHEGSCMNSGLDFQLHLGNNVKTNSVPDINLSPPMYSEPSATKSGEKSTITGTARITNVKTCVFQGCSKLARGALRLCIAHGGGRCCQKEKCGKGAEGSTPYCKGHGGGKRCGFDGCGKSAQGSTDFCKAHGGGRRCLWRPGCDRLARGRSGMCAAHSGLVQDFCVRGGSAVGGSGMKYVSVPEGRVHDGSFLAFLSSNADAGGSM